MTAWSRCGGTPRNGASRDGRLAETVVHLLWTALAVRENLGLLSMHRLDRRSPERCLSKAPEHAWRTTEKMSRKERRILVWCMDCGRVDELSTGHMPRGPVDFQWGYFCDNCEIDPVNVVPSMIPTGPMWW